MEISNKFVTVSTDNQINEDYEGRAKCPLCSKTFSQKYLVPRHIRIEHENQRIECSLCGLLVRNIHTHKRIKHGTESKLKCSICLKMFKSKVLLREHCKQEHGSICVPNPSAVEMKCPACELIIVNKRSLWHSHIYYQHMVPLEMFECPVPDCSSRIAKIQEDYCLKKHLESYHALKIDKIHKCERCPMKFVTSEAVDDHVETMHPNNRFNCSLCIQEFDCYSMMVLHIFQQHNYIIRGNCPGFKNIKCNPNTHKKVRDVDNKRHLNHSPSDSDVLQIQKKSKNIINFSSHEMNIKSSIIKSPTIEKDFLMQEFVEDSNSMESDVNIANYITNPEKIEDKFTCSFDEGDFDLPDGVKVVENNDEYIMLEINQKNICKETVTEELNNFQIKTPKIITSTTHHEIDKKIDNYEVLIDTGKDTNISEDNISCENENFNDQNIQMIGVTCDIKIIQDINSLKTNIQVEKKTDSIIKEASWKVDNTLLNTESEKFDYEEVLDAECKEATIVNDTADATAALLEYDNADEELLEDKEELTFIHVDEYSDNLGEGRKSKTKFQCPIENCKSTFSRKDSISLHIRNVHGCVRVTCNICLKEYTSESNLKTHIKSVHKNIAAMCTWPNCNKVLSSWRQMKNHVRKHKQSLSRHKCTVSGCNLIYKNRVTLNNHMKKHQPSK